MLSPLRCRRTTVQCSTSQSVPDGRYIATAGQPPRVTIWDTRTFRQVAGPLPLDVNAIEARARFAPDGRLVVTSGSKLEPSRSIRAVAVEGLPRGWPDPDPRGVRGSPPGPAYTPACA
jgi:hypothetical protein